MRPLASKAAVLIGVAIVIALWFKTPALRSASVVSILVAGIILALSVASILSLPRHIVRKSTTPIVLEELSATDRLKAENDVRGTLFQAIAGALLLLGAFLTWQQVQSGAEQVRVSQRQLEIGQEGQITERFTRAIDQLGSENVDVRLGGIYALERIAKNSPKDQDAITDILSAYTRGHSPWKPSASRGQRLNTVDSEYSKKLSELQSLQVRAADVQAILDIFGRRPTVTANSKRLNLERTDLRKADLPCRLFHTLPDRCSNLAYADLNLSNLDGAVLYGANLSASTFYAARFEKAGLQGADLRGTILDLAHLRNANLEYAKMGTLDEYLKGPQGVTLSSTRMNSIRQADLSNASLKGASLKNAILWRTTLKNANLEDADLTDADLTEVDLRGAKLKNAKLKGAQLARARASSDTIWPEGFDWKAAGVVIAS